MRVEPFSRLRLGKQRAFGALGARLCEDNRGSEKVSQGMQQPGQLGKGRQNRQFGANQPGVETTSAGDAARGQPFICLESVGGCRLGSNRQPGRGQPRGIGRQNVRKKKRKPNQAELVGRRSTRVGNKRSSASVLRSLQNNATVRGCEGTQQKEAGRQYVGNATTNVKPRQTQQQVVRKRTKKPQLS